MEQLKNEWIDRDVYVHLFQLWSMCSRWSYGFHVQPTQSWFMHDGPVDGSCTTGPVIVPVQQTGWWLMYNRLSYGLCSTDWVMAHVQQIQLWFLYHRLGDGSCTTNPVMVPVQQTRWWFMYNRPGDGSGTTDLVMVHIHLSRTRYGSFTAITWGKGTPLYFATRQPKIFAG